MRLTAVKQYMKTNGSVNLLQLCQHFNSDAEIMRDMLNRFINKGVLRRAPALPGCGSSCSKCNPLLTEIYQWVVD